MTFAAANVPSGLRSTNGRLWSAVSEISCDVTKPCWGENGQTIARNVDAIVQYAPLPGHQMLKPGPDELARDFRNALQTFRAIEQFGGVNIRPAIKERRQVARVFERGLKTAARAFDEIEEVRRFIAAHAVANLKNWGKHVGAPANFHAALHGRTLELGASAFNYQKTMIPETFRRSSVCFRNCRGSEA
jgi:hypothetical protein